MWNGRQCYFQQINLIGSTIARGSSSVHLHVPLGAELKMALRIHRKSATDQMFLENSVLTVVPNCNIILHSNDLCYFITSLRKILAK